MALCCSGEEGPDMSRVSDILGGGGRWQGNAKVRAVTAVQLSVSQSQLSDSCYIPMILSDTFIPCGAEQREMEERGKETEETKKGERWRKER